MRAFTYPPWARTDWGGSKGWTTSDEEARLTVLERFSGLIFAPSPTLDRAGEMTAETETGVIHVDDVYFR